MFDPSGLYGEIETSDRRAVAGQFGSLELYKHGSSYTGSINIVQGGGRPAAVYAFIQAFVTHERLTCTTQTVKGRYYKFDGVFRRRGVFATSRDFGTLAIEGDLVEFKSGKVFKKTHLRLADELPGD
jgi:hypothetical protein